MSAGRRRADKKAEPRPKRLPAVLVHVLGVLVTAGAWIFLVRAAITFGRAGRDGRGAAWAVCAGATLGAAVCLLLVFVLLARTSTLLGLRNERAPKRSAGGRRGAR